MKAERKFILENADLTQKQICLTIDVSQSFVSKVRNKERMSKHDIKLFIINHPKMSQKDMAKKIGRSPSCIQKIRKELIPQRATGGNTE